MDHPYSQGPHGGPPVDLDLPSLRARRAWLGMTQGEAADRAGITRPNWCRIERGTQRPRPRVALAMAHALGVPLEAILARVPAAGGEP